MELKKLVIGPLSVNCYLLQSEENAVVIDPCLFTDALKEFCDNNSNKKITVLLTHCHFDHILGANKIRELYGAQIMIGREDEAGLFNTKLSLSDRFRAKQTPFNADVLLSDGDVIDLGDIKIKVISTPGHTVGGVSYLCGDALFSGDTLFYESFGRTDFYGGNAKQLKASIDKLLELPEQTVVYSGHGEETTVSHEKKYNVYKGYL